MKKLAKFVALFLAGTMTLVMTACNNNEESMKQQILREINAYRIEQKLEPVQEVNELSQMTDLFIQNFERTQKTRLLLEEMQLNESNAIWFDLSNQWWTRSGYGAIWEENGRKPEYYELTAEYLSETELRAQIRESEILVHPDDRAVGIAFAHIDGKCYWLCSTFYPAS